jgi:hypothetical protein
MMSVTVYSEVEDLMIADLMVPDPDIKFRYLISAAREINAVVGATYVVPLNLDELEPNSLALIQLLSTKIASARLLMSLAIPGEDNRPNAYARYLLREAQDQLELIQLKKIPLEGATLRDDKITYTGPGVINRDEESPLEAFENAFMRGGTPWTWAPGPL